MVDEYRAAAKLAPCPTPIMFERTVAREEGMCTLREDGIAKVRAGQTSLEEVLRVTA